MFLIAIEGSKTRGSPKVSFDYGAMEFRLLTRAKTEAEAKAETKNLKICTCG